MTIELVADENGVYRPVGMITASELAARANITHQGVTFAVRTGKLAAIRIGDALWIDDSAAAAWLVSRRRPKKEFSV